MEELHTVVKNMLFELSQETVDSASKKAAQRNLDLLAFSDAPARLKTSRLHTAGFRIHLNPVL